MTNYNKPLPQPDRTTEEFWRAAKRHELLIPRCKSCNKYFFYPREDCPSCLSSNLEWVRVSGRGKIYSYTVVRQAAHPGFATDVPYILAIIELDEGPRMTSNVVDCRIEDVTVDMPVSVVFDDVTPKVTLVKFKPA